MATLEKIFRKKKGSKEKIELRGKITSELEDDSFMFTDIDKANCKITIKKQELLVKKEVFECGKYIKIVNPISNMEKNGLEIIESTLVIPTTKIKNLEDVDITEIVTDTLSEECTEPIALKIIKTMEPETVSTFSFYKRGLKIFLVTGSK